MESTVNIAAHQRLQAENDALLSRARSAERELADQREQVALLREELAQLKRLIFGAKSERFVPEGAPNQLPLFEGAPPPPEPRPPETQVVKRRPRKKAVRQPLPADGSISRCTFLAR